MFSHLRFKPQINRSRRTNFFARSWDVALVNTLSVRANINKRTPFVLQEYKTNGDNKVLEN